MAKQKKRRTRKPKFPPPLNMSDDLNDMSVVMTGCLTLRISPLLGTLTIVTPIGHYDFILDAEIATGLMGDLDEFLSGASAKLID